MSFELGIKVGFFPPNSQLNVDMVIVADRSAAVETDFVVATEPKPGLQVWFQKNFADDGRKAATYGDLTRGEIPGFGPVGQKGKVGKAPLRPG